MERHCAQTTGQQILRLFALAQRHVLQIDGHEFQAFEHRATDQQQRVLALIGVPEAVFGSPRGRVS